MPQRECKCEETYMNNQPLRVVMYSSTLTQTLMQRAKNLKIKICDRKEKGIYEKFMSDNKHYFSVNASI